MNTIHRRNFLKTTLGAGALALPHIFPGSLFGANSPNKKIQVAQIGCGRMGRDDMKGILGQNLARVVAVCDLDPKRRSSAKELVVQYYQKKGESSVDVTACANYHELLARPDIDAVVISLPDHWHALAAIEAAIAGKHIYVQKPITYSIAESIALRTVVRAKKVILQTGSQQRSANPFGTFRKATEAVRNGRIGKLQTVKIGVGLDKPSGKAPAAMPVPEGFDFQRWLGSAPQQDYMEGRVHPQNSFDGRPGWITTEDFGLGMITNWGAHHIDIAHWGMDQSLGGPSIVEAKADFMKNDVWTVHHNYHVEMTYPHNVQLIMDDKFANGIRFEGDEGWVFCARGGVAVTASDPNKPTPASKALYASKDSILSPLGSNDVHRWPSSPGHYQNWIESIIANRDPIAPVDQAARSLQACCTAWIAMKLGRKLTWDAAKEAFINDDEANALRSRKARTDEFDIQLVMKKAGI